MNVYMMMIELCSENDVMYICIKMQEITFQERTFNQQLLNGYL